MAIVDEQVRTYIVLLGRCDLAARAIADAATTIK
jgi:hypothetical protein